MAFGAISAFVAVYLFGAGVLSGLLVYSVGGAACTLAAAWFRFRCVERGELGEKLEKPEKLVAAR